MASSTTDQGWPVLRNASCLSGREIDCGVISKPFHACCPTGYQCHQNIMACCSPGNNCTETLLTASGKSRCADSSWSLFGSGDDSSFFCCDAGSMGWSSGNANGCTKDGSKLDKQQTLLTAVAVQADREKPTDSSSSTNKSDGNSNSTSKTKASHSSSSSPSPSSSTPIGAIVGGVVGGLAFLALILFLAWFLLRRRKRAKTLNNNSIYTSNPTAITAVQSPSEMIDQTQTTQTPPVDMSAVKYRMDADAPLPPLIQEPVSVPVGSSVVNGNVSELPATPAIMVGSEQRPAELPSLPSPPPK